jgi:transcriptional regulator with XRE-family HTH domain
LKNKRYAKPRSKKRMIEAMPIDLLATMGSRLAALRRQREWGQKELAAAIRRYNPAVDVTESAISAVEKGRRNPSWELITAWADVLEVSLDFISGRVNVADVIADQPAPEWLYPETRIVGDIMEGLPDAKRTEVVAIVQAIAKVYEANKLDARAEAEMLSSALASADILITPTLRRRIEEILIAYRSGGLGTLGH